VDILPFDEWQAGTLQNSVPANNNALRSEVLAAAVISKTATAQPGSPADGDCYIIPAGATGTQWATFAEDSLAYFRGGTWYEFTAFEGLLKVVAGAVNVFNGSAWEAVGGGGGGGSLEVEESGVLVEADVTTINFTGSGVSVSSPSAGVVEVEISGGGGGGSLPDSFAEIPSTWDAFWLAVAGNSSGTSVGIASPTFVGTAGSMTPTSTSIFTATPHIPYSTGAAATNAIASVRHSFDIVSRAHGFRFSTTFGIDFGAETASHRLFVGLRTLSSVASDVEPSTIVNGFGIGYDSADTQFQLIHNDGSGTATKTALGASFAKPTASRDAIWRLDLWGSSDTSVINYRFKNIGTGATSTGTITTDIPAASVGLNCNSYISAGGTSTRVGFAWCKFAYGKPG
jgi:hypothetical protein